MSTTEEQAGHDATFAPKQSGDTHSYKGWLNSDSFLKRAFAVLGYSCVASLILYIPILVIAFLIGGSAVLMSMSGVDQYHEENSEWYGGNPYEEEYAPTDEGLSSGKLDMRAVCEGALAYMTFPSGAEAEAFVEDCIAGNRPEVIERYKADMGISDEVAL